MKIPFSVKLFLDRFPNIFLWLVKRKRFSHWSLKKLVSPSTSIVIEGFPRCANSFCVLAFKQNNPSIVVSDHLHFSSHVIKSCRLGLPTLVVIRDPDDAVCSFLAFSIWNKGDGKIELSAHQIDLALKYYILFHERISAYSSQFYLAHFPEVTGNITAVVSGFNLRFNTNFLPPLDIDSIFSVARHVGPNNSRQQIISRVKSSYHSLADLTLKKRARYVFNDLCAKHQIEL